MPPGGTRLHEDGVNVGQGGLRKNLSLLRLNYKAFDRRIRRLISTCLRPSSMAILTAIPRQIGCAARQNHTRRPERPSASQYRRASRNRSPSAAAKESALPPPVLRFSSQGCANRQ